MKKNTIRIIALFALAAWSHAADNVPVTLSVTAPMDYQVIQRQSVKGGKIHISGRCEADCDRIEARVLGTDSAGKAYDSNWKPVSFDPAAKSFDDQLAVAAGGWYAVSIRALKDGKPVAEAAVAHVGMGEVFVGAGQSNSTSCGGLGSKSPRDGRTQLVSGMVTTFDGRQWRKADDPQPGAHDQATYTYGSFWPAFGDAMNARYHVPIGVAVTGHGGTSIKAWKAGSPLFAWSLTRMKQLGPHGFRAVLWHQGESDAEMPAQNYADGLGAIIAAFRKEAGWDMPWFVAHASFRPGKPTTETGSRGGQTILWTQKIAFEGPDTDHMLGELRDHDGKGIHFSRQGLKAHGEAWAEKVGVYLDPILKKE